VTKGVFASHDERSCGSTVTARRHVAADSVPIECAWVMVEVDHGRSHCLLQSQNIVCEVGVYLRARRHVIAEDHYVVGRRGEPHVFLHVALPILVTKGVFASHDERSCGSTVAARRHVTADSIPIECAWVMVE